MKRCIAILVLCSLASAAAAKPADDVCAGVRSEVDAFGGGTNLSANVQSAGKLNPVGMTLILQSGRIGLDMILKEGGALNGGVVAGTPVLFSFTDGTVLTLTTNRDNPMTADVAGNVILTDIPFTIDLTPEQVHVMATTPLRAIRFPIPRPFDWQPKESLTPKLQAAALCVEKQIGATKSAPVEPAP